jgi:hypothetical protein
MVSMMSPTVWAREANLGAAGTDNVLRLRTRMNAAAAASKVAD